MLGLFQWFQHACNESELSQKTSKLFRVRIVLPDAGTPEAETPKVALPYSMVGAALEAQRASCRENPMGEEIKTAQDFVHWLNARQITITSPESPIEVHALRGHKAEPDHPWIRCIKDSASTSTDLSIAFGGIDMQRVPSQRATEALEAQLAKIAKAPTMPVVGTREAGPGPSTEADVDDTDDTAMVS